MTNLEKFKQLLAEELAELFLKQVFNSGVIYVYEDYDFDEAFYDWEGANNEENTNAIYKSI